VTTYRTETLRLHHRVRVIHGGTGDSLERIHARLKEPAWPHWVLRRRGADLLVSTWERFEANRPQQSAVQVQISDPILFERFALGSGTEEVPLRRDQDAEVELELDPTPVVLRVTLRNAIGGPRTGRTVRVERNGDAANLAETGPGVYETGPRAFLSGPYKLLINGQQRRVLAIDWSQPVTRLQLLDP
jgi:hypothetical protein